MRFSSALILSLAALLLGPAAALADPGDPVLVSSPGALGALPAQGVNDAGWVEGAGLYDGVSLSDDGRYSVFSSQSDGLSPDDDDRYANVFRKDRTTGAVVLVSRATGAAGAGADGYSYGATISDDGNLVAFTSAADNLAAGDTDVLHDVYVRNISAGTTTLISVGGPDCGTSPNLHDPVCGRAVISGNGQFVAYTSDAALTGGDTGTLHDVYRRKVDGTSPVLVSQVEGSAPVRAGNKASWDPSIDDSGNLIAFTSYATDLSITPSVTDNNVQSDIFVRNVTTGDVRVGSAVNGGQVMTLGNYSRNAILSGDGSAVAFVTGAKDADPTVSDADNNEDAYLRIFATAKNHLINRANGFSGAKADGFVSAPLGISDDAEWILFESDGMNLGGSDDRSRNVYVRRFIPAVNLGATIALSNGPQGPSDGTRGGAISGDAKRALITSQTSLDATPRDETEVYERAVASPPGAAELVSRPAGSAPYAATDLGVDSDKSGGAMRRQISADGRYAVFASASDGLSDADLDSGDNVLNVYRRDLLTGALDLVSRATGADGAGANARSAYPTISADGQRVAFASDAGNLGFDNPNGDGQLYVRDLAAQTTVLVSRRDGAAGTAFDWGDDAELSADGRRVAFVADDGTDTHAYVRDLAAGTTELVDRADGPSGAPAGDGVTTVSLSGDGTRAAFVSDAKDLVPGVSDSVRRVYVRDLSAGTTTLVSRADGAAGAPSTKDIYNAEITVDGNRVAWATEESALVPGAGAWPASTYEVVLRDLATQTTQLVSRAGSVPADHDVGDFTMDATGDRFVFVSGAANLVPGVNGAVDATFVLRLSGGPVTTLPGWQASDESTWSGYPVLSADGRCLLFSARGAGPGSAPSPDFVDAYVRSLDGGTCPTPAAAVVLPDPPRADPPKLDPPRTPPAAAPKVTKLKLSHKRFTVAKAATPASARATAAASKKKAAKKKKPKTPAGTTLGFTLSAKAAVTVTLEAKTTGRSTGKGKAKRCVKPTKKLRKAKAKRCTLYVKAGTLKRASVKAGTVKIAFTGRIGKKALKPGVYRATVVASAGGKSSAPARASFTVVKK